MLASLIVITNILSRTLARPSLIATSKLRHQAAETVGALNVITNSVVTSLYLV